MSGGSSMDPILTSPEKPEEKPVEAPKEDPKRKALLDDIGAVLEKHGVKHGIFLAWAETQEQDPYILMRGNKLAVARLTALWTRHIKEEIDQTLAV